MVCVADTRKHVSNILIQGNDRQCMKKDRFKITNNTDVDITVHFLISNVVKWQPGCTHKPDNRRW
jgi:hypothetical protein